MIAVSSLLFWLVAIPFCLGLVPANFISPRRRSPGLVFLAGYFLMWAVYGLVTIPAVLWVEYDNFKIASAAFTVLSILGAASGLLLWERNRRNGGAGFLGPRKENDINVTNKLEHQSGWRGRLTRMLRAERIEWLIFFALLGFQLYKAAVFASFDGDDAYYVVESLIAQEAGTMYRILPLTGGSTGLDVRHALAVFPMWVAFVSVKAGVHATIVSHVVMPLVLIPLTYLLYYEIGRMIFGRTGPAEEKQDGAAGQIGRRGFPAVAGADVFHRENLPVFMILMAMFQIFGNVSIYTSETFFLTRTWQGKAVAGALVIPAVVWVFLQIYDSGVRKGRTDAGLWLLYVCINMTAGVCSSIAVFLICILTALTTFCLAVSERDWRILFKAGAACIPSVIYMAVYVFMAYSYLL